MFKLDLEKAEKTGDQNANIHWIIEKAREFQRNIYFCFIDYAKAFVWIKTNCGNFFKMTLGTRNMWSSLNCLAVLSWSFGP